ncbi:hypothetical protein TrVFT333_001246 [Trichoderma virens FT-333]|nr:hypothetical protein TrVFT333_001246 [Trichoderma virens FT-333]
MALETPSAFPHHHLPLARAKSPDRSPFCLASPRLLLRRPTLLAQPHRKKKPFLEFGAFFDFFVCVPSEDCSNYDDGHPTTSDDHLSDKHKHENERKAESHC